VARRTANVIDESGRVQSWRRIPALIKLQCNFFMINRDYQDYKIFDQP